MAGVRKTSQQDSDPHRSTWVVVSLLLYLSHGIKRDQLAIHGTYCWDSHEQAWSSFFFLKETFEFGNSAAFRGICQNYTILLYIERLFTAKLNLFDGIRELLREVAIQEANISPSKNRKKHETVYERVLKSSYYACCCFPFPVVCSIGFCACKWSAKAKMPVFPPEGVFR